MLCVTVFVLVQDHFVMGLRDQVAGEAARAGFEDNGAALRDATKNGVLPDMEETGVRVFDVQWLGLGLSDGIGLGTSRLDERWGID